MRADLKPTGTERAALRQDLVESVDRYGRERLDARAHDRAHRLPEGLLTELAELGVFGLSLPEGYGGSGLDMGTVAAVVSTLARHDRSVATTVGLHLGLGTRGLLAYGSEAQHARWLPDLASGRRIAAFATTEPEAGSDLAAIRTRAVPEGDGLRVDGEKIFVTNGGFAGLYTITASTPGLGGARRGHGLLVLERGDPGLHPGPEEDKLGLRASSTTGLLLDGVHLPMDRLLGEPGQGMAQLAHVLSWGRTLMAAGCVGTAEAALQATARHVAIRRQFGRSLDRFEVVREQLAHMAATRFAMEALVADTTELEGEPDRLLDRSVSAKVLCSEGACDIADLGVQLHGGAGFIEETGLALMLRDARITRIFEGANDVLRVHLGLGEAGRPAPRSPLVEDRPHCALASEADRLAARIADWRATLVADHGLRVLGRQRLMHRLGSLVVLRDACDAAVRQASPETRPYAAHWLALARSRAEALLAPLPASEPIDHLVAGLHQELP